MTRDEIVREIKSHQSEIEALGVRRLAIFGSVARGESREASDIDMLVGFEGPTTFDNYFDLKFLLEDILGRKVDLVTEKALRPELASEVNRELLNVTP